MKLALLKIDYIDEREASKVIQIPIAGIAFEWRGQTIHSQEPVAIEMGYDGMFKNIIRDVQFEVYVDQSIFTEEYTATASLFSILAREDVQRAIYSEVAKRCKVVPMCRVIDERELFCREFENAYMQMMEV